MLGVGWRFDRIRTYMAEAAGHADAVGPNQILILVVTGIFVEPLRVPLPRGCLVEGWVWEQPQADDPGRISVERTRREVLASRAQLHALVFGLVLEGVGRTIRAALVEP